MSKQDVCDMCYAPNTASELINNGPPCWCPPGTERKEESPSAEKMSSTNSGVTITPSSSITITIKYDTFSETLSKCLEECCQSETTQRVTCTNNEQVEATLELSRQGWSPCRTTFQIATKEQDSDHFTTKLSPITTQHQHLSVAESGVKRQAFDPVIPVWVKKISNAVLLKHSLPEWARDSDVMIGGVEGFTGQVLPPIGQELKELRTKRETNGCAADYIAAGEEFVGCTPLEAE